MRPCPGPGLPAPGASTPAMSRQSLDPLERLVALNEINNGHTLSVDNARWRETYLEINDAEYSDWLIEVQLALVDIPDTADLDFHSTAGAWSASRACTCMSCQPSACNAAPRRMPSTRNPAFAATRHDAKFATECANPIRWKPASLNAH